MIQYNAFLHLNVLFFNFYNETYCTVESLTVEALNDRAASAEYPSKNVTHIFSSTNLFRKKKNALKFGVGKNYLCLLCSPRWHLFKQK